MDPEYNNCGEQLIMLCQESDIHILNGRTNGDPTGHLTFVTKNGCSLIDYFLISSDIFCKQIDMWVEDEDMTQHFPVKMTIKAAVVPSVTPGIPHNSNASRGSQN